MDAVISLNKDTMNEERKKKNKHNVKHSACTQPKGRRQSLLGSRNEERPINKLALTAFKLQFAVRLRRKACNLSVNSNLIPL